MALEQIVAWLGAVGLVAFTVWVTATGNRLGRHTWLVPAAASAAFLAWSLWAMASEGLFGFWTEHTRNKWGNQIWLDLLFAIAIGWWLILPQARALRMQVWVWLVLVLTTGCISFLAMMSRYLYLKSRSAA